MHNNTSKSWSLIPRGDGNKYSVDNNIDYSGSTRSLGARPNGYPNVIQFRDITQDSGTATKTITITNHGDEPAVLSSVTNGNSEFSVTTPTLPATIQPSKSVAIQVEYTPTSSTPLVNEGAITFNYDNSISQICHIFANKQAVAKSAIDVFDTGSTQFLDQNNTIYTLQEDITTPDIAFVAASQYSELDLNGYTITYNTGGTDYSAGIYNSADFAQTPPPRDGFTSQGCRAFYVHGGSIVEGSTTSQYSHCIHFMQNSARNGLLIEDLTLVPKGISSVGIGPQGFPVSIIDNVIVNSEVTVINNRHQLEGYMIKLIPTTGNYGYLFEDVTLNDGAQGGIACSGEDTHHVNVTSNHKELYVNGFGIHTGGSIGSRIYDCTITPVSGRGIGSMEQAGDTWMWNNLVNVTSTITQVGESSPTTAYGIQFETSTDGVAWGNNVTATASLQAEANCIRSTNTSSKHYVYKNTLNAVREGSTGFISSIYGLVVSDQCEGWNNTCTTDQSYISTTFDSFNGLRTYEDKVIVGSNPAAVGSGRFDLVFASLYLGDADDSLNNFIVDVDTEIPVSRIYGEASATSLYTLDVGYSVKFVSNVGEVDIAVLDSQSNPSESGQTDSAGSLDTSQVNTRYYNDAVDGVLTLDLSDHTYTATKSGYTPVNAPFDASQSQTVFVNMEVA